MSPADIGLPEALEHAASALASDADAIRPANGDPFQLASLLDDAASRRVLAWLLANEPAAGEELALLWADDPEGAGRHVLALDGASLTKPARKALRRILHRLRSQGLEVPKTSPCTVVATLPEVKDQLEEAALSPLNGRGARMVYLALDRPTGGARLFELVLADPGGILEFEVYNTSRSRVRRFLKEFQKGGRIPAVSADPGAVRALIARAIATHPAERPWPKGFSEYRSRLTSEGDSAETPGKQVRAVLDASREADALEHVVAWVQEGTVGPWPPEPDRVQALVEGVTAAGEGLDELSPSARQERLDAALADARAKLFDEAFRELTAERFDETAYVFWRGDREAEATLALAAANAFRAGAASDPIAHALVAALLAPVLEKISGESPPDPVASPVENP